MELALMSIQRFVTKSLFLSPFLFFFFEKECIYWAKAFLYYLKKEYYLKFWSRRESWNFDIFLIFECDSLSRIFFINKNNRNIVNDIAWLTRYKEGRIFLFVNSKLLSTSYTNFISKERNLNIKLSFNRTTPFIYSWIHSWRSRVWLYLRAITRNDLIIFLLEET